MKTDARDMHRDDTRRGRRYGHRDHSDHHDHTRRHKKHRRHAKEDDSDIHGDHHDSKDRKSEELVQDLAKDEDSPPLLPSSRDSDIVVEWTRLPRDVVFCILDKLLEPIDHVRFAIVSKEWGVVANYYNHTTKRWSKQQQPLPMLMIPTATEGEHKLYSVTETRIYDHIPLPAVPYNGKCYGSNYGWLAVIDRSLEEIWISDMRKSPYGHEVVVTTYRITLQNPFRKGIEAIHLPPLKYSFLVNDERYRYIVPHVILSADPTLHPENYLVLAFCNHHLPFAFIRGGQKDWVRFKSEYVRGNYMYSNAIIYRDQIYAIEDFASEMMKADVNYSSASTSPPERRLHFVDQTKCRLGNPYLVESTTGDLLCVRKTYENKKDGRRWSSIERFRVYKILFSEKDEFTFDMLEMENIGDEAIFVMDSHSMCVSASKYAGCQPNSIYYTTDDSRKLFAASPTKSSRKCEMGVYNLDHKVMTTLYSSEDERYWNNYMPHWVLPSFNGLFF